MRDALNATGRPIYFDLCGWSSWYAPVGKTLGNAWRVGYDRRPLPAAVAVLGGCVGAKLAFHQVYRDEVATHYST